MAKRTFHILRLDPGGDTRIQHQGLKKDTATTLAEMLNLSFAPSAFTVHPSPCALHVGYPTKPCTSCGLGYIDHIAFKLEHQ